MEQDNYDNYVYSSPSADSITGSSNDEDMHTEEVHVFKDEGESGLVYYLGER